MSKPPCAPSRVKAERKEWRTRPELERLCNALRASWHTAQQEADGLAAALAQAQKERDRLAAWKEEAISVMPDYQAIGKLLGVRLGESIHDKIVPGLREKDARIADLELWKKEMSEELTALCIERAKLVCERMDLSLFMEDCQLLLAQSRDTLCGTKFIQAGGLQEAFRRYADRTSALGSKPGQGKIRELYR